MPTYVYKCDSCGTQFEQFQSFKDEPLRICPSCAGAVRRVFQPVGIVFKGGGWYITDSRKSSSATMKSADGETAPSGDAAKSSDTKTETATESKSETTTSTPASDTSPSTSTPSTSASSPTTPA